MYLHQGEGSDLLSLKKDTHSGYGYRFAFPDHHISVNSTICRLIESLIHHYGNPHKTSFHQGTHFIAKEVRSWKKLIVISPASPTSKEIFSSDW